MFFLPSFLEYSKDTLANKLVLIGHYPQIFYDITKQKEGLSIHLDLVLKEFAEINNANRSLSLKNALSTILLTIPNTPLNFSIHIMGTPKDELAACKELQDFVFPTHWIGTIYSSEDNFNRLNKIIPFNWQAGIWYDLNEWSNTDFSDFGSSLLMTVKAGKSGQESSLDKKLEAINIATKNPNHRFVLDGGWSVDFESDLSNLEIVSHKSFWTKYVKTITESDAGFSDGEYSNIEY